MKSLGLGIGLDKKVLFTITSLILIIMTTWKT